MILVIGGIASGKRTYVLSHGYGEDDIDDAVLGEAPVLYGLESLLRKGALDESALDSLLHKDVVCCCEVGMGVVPIDPEERAWRELVGRTCTLLAERSETVIRMVCGIPVTLRGGNEC